MSGSVPRTRVNVYVDGFNFYYGAFSTPGVHSPFAAYKWLDLRAYTAAVLGPSFEVQTVRYFTTRVKPTASDPDKHFRQDAYFRALEAHADVRVHAEGQFRTRQKRAKIIEPGYPQKVVSVELREEKGADVNLATWLVYEACQGVFDAAVVVSDDSDLLGPVRLVQDKLGKDVFVIHLRKRRSSFAHAAKYVYHGDKTHFFAGNQLPPAVTLPNGKTVMRPSAW